MRFAARFFSRCISFLLIFAVLLPTFSPLALAQTTTPATTPTPLQAGQTQTSNTVSPYAQPNIDPNIPANMHTLAQYILIEMMVALGCQLSGIDLSSPTQPCLAPNPFTSKIGYAPQPENGKLQIGGVLGVVGNGIATMYTPTVTTSDYTRYLANSFGLVKQTFAAPPKDAFEGFSPLLGLWTASRNIAYFLLILAFVFIGIGVMMRIQLDPRTVMTIQNQIPRVIIAIILITFSYSIAALMADVMWASSYLMINVVSDATGDRELKSCGNNPGPRISSYATENVLSAPISFVNLIYREDNCGIIKSGIADVSKNVANNITGLQTDIVMAVFGLDPDATCSWNQGTNSSGGSILDYIPFVSQARTAIGIITNPGDIGDCIFYGPFGKLMNKIISAGWWIAVFFAMIITLVRIWFMLLKAYAYIFLYVILAPMFIVLNLLPKKPLGMGRWLKVFFVNLAIFPITILMLLLSRAFMDMFDQGANKVFVPPLVGNPNHDEFGAIIAFATLLIIPGMYSLLREKMGLQDVKQTAIGGQTFGAGRGAASYPARKTMKYLNWHDQQGRPVGPLAIGLRRLGNKFTGVDSGRKIPVLSNMLLRRQVMDAHPFGWDAAAEAHYDDLRLQRDLKKKHKGWNAGSWAEYQGKSKLYTSSNPRFKELAAEPPVMPPSGPTRRTPPAGAGGAGTPPVGPAPAAGGGGPARRTPPAGAGGAGTPPVGPRP